MQVPGPAPQGFTGTINLRLTDLIQMVCLSRSDLIIDVVSQKGKGSIHIRQGQIHHAQTGSVSGTEAFFEILQWNYGRFEILPFENNGIHSVNKPWEHLLLEAMRLQDEKLIKSEAAQDGAYHLDELPEGPGPGILAKIDDVLGDLLEFDQYPDVLQQKESNGPEASYPSLKVLIVDESALFSKELKGMLEFDPAIEVVGIARNGKESLEFLESGMPVHLIALVIDMPVMTGDTVLKRIMIRYRIPVLIIGSLEPHSMQKALDFLRLGAVDHLAKPGVHDDLASYGENLRKLVRSVAKARVSNFRQLRKRHDTGRSHVQTAGPADHKILIIVGAEGAHMDWPRLPLQTLCGQCPVIGLQKLDDGFAHRFARLIEDKTGVKTQHLSAVHEIAPGNFYLANARHEAEFKLRPEKHSIDVDVTPSTTMDWGSGVELWLERLAEQARDAMTVYFMSAAEPLPGSLIAKLLAWKVRHIVSPPETVVCPRMIESIQPYAACFPDLVLQSGPDTLPEIL